MKNYQLNNIDPEDLEDFLVKTETSFGIRFTGDELRYISTFGQLCDHIISKIQLDHADGCTTQQAFYKMRNAIATALPIDRSTITPDLPLIRILPEKNRRLKIKQLEQELGIRLHLLRPPHWITGLLLIALFIALAGFLFNWSIALSGLVLTIAGLWLANRAGNTLALQTVGQVAEKRAREHYVASRRNPETVNKNEIEKVLTDWFCGEFTISRLMP